jgi:SAM-dependent methyltransferase
MDESLKTKNKRSSDFFSKYLSGNVIDIGAGNDLVTPNAERFDMEDGDANHISQYRKVESYDSVHSSHCLEHMVNPANALNEWWSLVKPGGYMIIVVPDEDLYEQGIWPSIFNVDHKSSFTLKSEKSWSPVSYNLEKLIEGLRGSEVISIERHDDNYNYSFKSHGFAPKRIDYLAFKKLRIIVGMIPLFGGYVTIKLENLSFKLFGYPIDQTARDALAQLQIVVKKLP